MSHKHWTPAEINQLRELYPHRLTSELAVLFGRSPRAVGEKANQIGLKKTQEFFASTLAARLDGLRGRANRFKPGHQPWNTGLKGWRAGGRSAETRFKPGNKPHTWRPIGHERLTKEGYLQRKIADTGCTRRDYVNVHWLLWIEHHGPIPPGMRISFKDRNPRNIVIDNLECISLGENMRRNSVHNLPKEVVQAIRLIGAINRKLNRYKKETQA